MPGDDQEMSEEPEHSSEMELRMLELVATSLEMEVK